MKKLIAAGASALLLGVAAAPAMAAGFTNSGVWIQANTTIRNTAVVSSSQVNVTSQRSASLGGLVALSGNFNTSTQGSAIIVAQGTVAP